MKFVIILLFSTILNADAIYDFWSNSNNINEKKRLQLKEIERNNTYLNKNDTTKPNIAKDFEETNSKETYDFIKPKTKDKYLKYNEPNSADPKIAKDLNPENTKISPDFIDERLEQEQKRDPSKKVIRRTPYQISNLEREKESDEENSYRDSTVVFYEETKTREESFIEIIPYATLGNNLFVIENGAYNARLLDDSISASMTIDLGLSYIWEDRNIGYLWNINFSDYDFSEKDRTHPNIQSSGDISGFVMSIMPTVFYELNRAESMSMLIGYGAGFSYIQIDGSISLADSNDQTITEEIEIDNFYFSHGLLLEIVHNNFMISFTKVNIALKEGGNDIDISENRLNLGYKFSF